MRITIYSAILALFAALTGCNTNIGEVTLTYNKATAIYGDLDEIRSASLITPSREIEDPEKIFMGENMLLIGEKGLGIHVYDNNDPNNPTPMSFISLPFTDEFFVHKNFIYAVSHYDMVKIDVSNMTAPVIVDRELNAFAEPAMNDNGEALIGFTYEVVTETLKLNGPEARALKEESVLYFDYMNNMIPNSSIPSSFVGNGTSSGMGTLNRIALTSDHLYVITGSSLLTFGNTPSDINLLDNRYIQSGMETVYEDDEKLFIGTETSMVIVDVSDGENPTVVSTYWHPQSCDPVLPNGDIAYVTLRSAVDNGCFGEENVLTVVDISDLQDPRNINDIPMESPYGMCIQNDHLLVGEGENGISIFDISSPSYPSNKIKFSHVVYDVIPHPTEENRILGAGENGLSQYEVDYDSGTMTLISSIAF